MSTIKYEQFVIAFGNRVRELRKTHHLTMEQLADLCNVEYSQISRIEKGKINTSISMALRIALALQIPMQELFDFIPPEEYQDF